METTQFTITGKDIAALNGVSNVSTRDFVLIKGLTSAAQPRITPALQAALSSVSRQNQLLTKTSPTSSGNYTVVSGVINSRSLKINGIAAASLATTPFTSGVTSVAVRLNTLELPPTFRLNYATGVETVQSPEVAIPIESDNFILYAKAGRS